MSDIVIKAEHLFKEYRLGVVNHGTLRHDLESFFARVRGKEDPNSLIAGSRASNKNKEELRNHFLALNDVSFEIRQGEAVGIIGRNGAGKSTLLKVLSRITTPTSGSLKIRGRITSLLEVGTGFHAELTGRENIYLNGAILGMRHSEVSRKMDEIVAFADLEKFIDTPVKRYSSGMHVRLAFAVAAHLDAEILVLDEVLAVGDAEFQKKCLGRMDDVARNQGRTVLFVSHNMGAISSLCTKGIVLSHGSVAFSGDTTGAVHLYLGSGNNTGGGRLEWECPPGGSNPASDIVRVDRYRLQNERGEVPDQALFNSRSYEVSIEAEILQPEPDLVFFVAYYTEDGTLVFVSGTDEAESTRGIGLSPGRKRISSAVPVELFAGRNYLVEVSCVIHGRFWALLPDSGQRLKFTFVRDLIPGRRDFESDHPFTGTRPPGIVSPVIPWSVADD